MAIKSKLLHNLGANYFGQIWVVLMSVLFIPIYIQYLGIEVYGLIGIYALLQSSLVILDLGLRAALGRETTRYANGENGDWYRDLLRSIELIFLIIVVVLIILINFLSEWLASNWFVYESLDPIMVADCLKIMGVLAGLRFLEGIYSSILLGQQRHVTLNLLLSCNATLRGLGAVGVLIWLSPTLYGFFIWQVVVSLTTLLSLKIIAYSQIEKGIRRAVFSLAELNRIKEFALSVAGASVLGAIIVNVDKVILSKLLPLSEFAIYTLAGTVSAIIFNLASPVSQTWLPKVTELFFKGNIIALNRTFHLGAQTGAALIGCVSIVLIVFAEVFLMLWIQDRELTVQLAPLVQVLALGNLFSGITRYLGQMAYAHGMTRLVLYFNVAAIFVIIPGVIVITPLYGALGAAWIWVTYTGSILFIGCPFIFRNILTKEMWRWYLTDTFIPLGVGAMVALSLSFALPEPVGIVSKFLVLVLAVVLTIVSTVSVMPELRSSVYTKFRSIILS